MSWRETECPNFETCGGEVQFEEETGENGPYADGHYNSWSFAVLSGDCSAGCMLTDEQVKDLEAVATEAMRDYEPLIP